MRCIEQISIRITLTNALLGILALIPAASVIAAGAQAPPAGDLTVKVRQLENGDVRFSLSGTAFIQRYVPNTSVTNHSATSGYPPVNFYTSYGLPDGLTLTMPANDFITSETEVSAQAQAQFFVDHPLNVVYSTSGWYLGGFNSGPLFRGDTIRGSGAVTTSKIPFSFLVPGTFVVEPGGFESEPDSTAAESKPTNHGIFPYFITYEVIAYDPMPSLALPGSVSFPKTIVRKSAKARKVTIKNNGNATLTDLSLSISGAAATDFSTSSLPVTTLAPDESVTVDLAFRAKWKGIRTAILTAKATYTPRQIYPPSVEEGYDEGTLRDRHARITATTSTLLSGTGILKPRPGRNRQPRSPRFPGGAR